LYLDSRKDGRSQRDALANNPAANAADRVRAGHDEHHAGLPRARQDLTKNGRKTLRKQAIGGHRLRGFPAG